jgi:hypothetical protein
MLKRIPLLFICAFSSLAFSQVYSVTVTAGGTGYSTAPTVTASGGACTTEPTFTSTVNTGALATVTPSYLGVGCTSAPTLAIGGPGTGATATASLLPVQMAIQDVIPTASCSGISPSPGGVCLAWRYSCWLTVPQFRVPFYNAKSPFVLPGTSQTTSVVAGENNESLPAPMVVDLTAGTLTEYSSALVISSSTATATVQASIVSACGAAQTALNAWNPWAFYGTYYLNGVWTALGVL